MMKKHGVFFLLALLVTVLVATVALAGSSPNYATNWNVVAKGGNAMASTNYAIQSTTGQTAIGVAQSGSFQVGSGYWYGVGETVFRVYLPIIFKNY